MRSPFVLTAIAFGVCSCNQPRTALIPAAAGLKVDTAVLDLGSVYLQARAEGSVRLVNVGEVVEEVELAVSGPFAIEGAASIRVPPGAGGAVLVAFAPSVAGPAQGSLGLRWAEGHTSVALTATGMPWPTCPAGSPCRIESFDPRLGACTSRPIADGTACDGGDVCLTQTQCVAGACVGQFLTCDDGIGCTRDGCASGQGCVHVPDATLCPASNPCQAYACDPATGCVGTTVADGTPCTPSTTACTGEGSCQAGICSGGTAPALPVGEVAWTYGPDAGPDTWRELEAVDGEGNSYGFELSGSQLFSLDTCGQVRWTQSLAQYPYGMALASGQLLMQSGGLLESRDPATGASSWQVDLASALGFCDGGPCGATIEGNLYAGPMVINNQGEIFINGSTPGPPWSLEVAAFSLDGSELWRSNVGMIQYTVGGANQVADLAGNFYFYQAGATSSLDLVSPQGALIAAEPSFAQTNLAVGPGYVLDLGGQPETAWSSTGTAVFTIGPALVPSPQFSSSAVVDDSGAFIFWPGAASTDTPGMVRVDAAGNPQASILIPGYTMSELALDESGRAYALGIGEDEHFELWAWDGVSAELSLDVDLGPVFDGTRQRQNGYSLFVSHGLAIVEIDQSLQAISVGPHGASFAPWSRGSGGANDNRRCPPPELAIPSSP